jgi:hypothetical protein
MGNDFGYLEYDILGQSFAHLSWFDNPNNPMNIILSQLNPIVFGE